jgi:lipoate-protein ligase A
MRLPVEAPRDGIAADEDLLERVHATGSTLLRWWLPAAPAVVVGLGLRHRLQQVVDLDRCAAAGIDVLERSAGGAALLLDDQLVCGAVCVPLPDLRVGTDITESYRWLGDLLVHALRATTNASVRRIDVQEARSDVASLRTRSNPLGSLILSTCFGALSPHEVALGRAKLVGIAQVRRRHAALFQFGFLLRDQAPLADLLRVPDEALRDALAAELRQRTVGLSLTPAEVQQWRAVVAAAMPDVAGAARGHPERP